MKPKHLAFFFLCLMFFSNFLKSQINRAETDVFSKKYSLSKTEVEQYASFRKNLEILPGTHLQNRINSSACSSQNNQNIGFELGNFSGWNLQKGTILNSVYDSIVNLAPVTTSYNVMNGGTDLLTGISLLSPFTGSYSIMLNDQYNNVEATQLSTKFVVTPANTLLKTAFSVIMQKAYHDCEGQPYFRIQVFSCSRSSLIGEYLIMGDESVFCSGASSTLYDKNIPGLSSYNITNWKKACFDLRNYVGEEVEVNVIMADCKYSGHYGYAFFDAEFGSLAASYAVATSFSVNGTPFNFNGSTVNQCFNSGSVLNCQNAASILYPIGSGSNSVAITNSLILNEPGYYNVIQSPVTGCDLLNELFIPVQPTVGITLPAGTLCPNAYYTATLSGAKDYTLKVNGVQTYTVQNFGVTSVPVSFMLAQNPGTITVIGKGGSANCTDSSSVVLQVYPQTSLTPVYTPTVCAGALTTFSAQGALTYTWNANAAFTPTFATTVFGTSQFNVQGTDALGCKTAISNFTVQGNYGASISYSLPNTGPVCEGDSILCSFSGATSFTWSNGFTGASQYLKPTTASPNYTVSAGALCSNTQTYAFNYVVWQGPAVNTFTVNHPGAALCPGSTFTVQGLGTNFYFKYGTNAGYTNLGFYTANAGIPSFTAIAQSTNGCGTRSVIPMVYLPSPTLSIGSGTQLCQGQIGSFTATGANTYTWDYTQGGATYTTAPSNSNYSVALYGVGVNGCFSNSVFPIQVENMLISASSNSANLCLGTNTLTLSARPFLTAGTYTWSTGANTQSITVTPTVSTIYTLTSNSALCGTKISTIGISVSANTVTPITVSLGPVCVGKVYTITANGASTYQYNYSAPTSSSTYTALATNTQVIYFNVSGTAANGCVSSNNFTFVPVPVVSLITSPITNYALCLNGQKTMTVSGASSYTWSTGVTGSLITVSPSVTTNYSVVGTSPNGCLTNSFGFVVTVITPPTVTISPSSLSVCPNSLFTLNASAGPGYFLSQWSDGTNAAQLTTSISATTVYSVTFSNNICSTSQTLQVYLFNPATLTLNSSAFCTGMPNTLSYTAAPTGGTLFVNGFAGNMIYANTASIYTVTYKYQDTGLCVLATHSFITVNPSPCVKLVADKYTACEGEQINLTGTPLGGTYFGGNLTGNVLTLPSAGVYTASYSYTDQQGCSATICQEVSATVCAGISESVLGLLQAYPNPSGGTVFIENPARKKILLRIYNMSGLLISSLGMEEVKTSVDLSGFKQGLYLFYLESEGASRLIKIIKE